LSADPEPRDERVTIVVGPERVRPLRRTATAGRWSRAAQVLVGASVLALLVAVFAISWDGNPRSGAPLVERPVARPVAPVRRQRPSRLPAQPFPVQEFHAPGEPPGDPSSSAADGSVSEPAGDSPADLATTRPTDNSAGDSGAPPSESPAVVQTDDRAAPPATAPDEATEPIESAPERMDAAAVVAQVNRLLQQVWSTAQVTPSPAVSDEEWCQRTFALILGRAARPPELGQLAADPATDRRARLVERLMGEPYRAEFAEYWGQTWADWLLENAPKEKLRLRAFQSGLQRFLAKSIADGKPYDDLVAELLTASGSNEPLQADFNEATNYLLAFTNRDATMQPVALTEEFCRVVLGSRIQCAQCHDDKLTGLPQERFWQMAAVFQPLEAEVLRPGRRRLRDKAAGAAEPVTYVASDGTTRTATPAGPDGSLLSGSATSPPRTQFAAQVVASDELRQAVVNRLWGHFLRYGFTLPVDDMGPHNQVSHPELVTLLSNQLAAHDNDLTQLIRWIVLSDAFDRADTITRGNREDFPDGGLRVLFSRYYHRSSLFADPDGGLRWLAAGGKPRVTNVANAYDREQIEALRQRDFEQHRKPTPAAVDDEIEMGQLLPIAYLRNVKSFTAAGHLDRAQQVQHVYMLVLGRKATADELAQAEAVYAAADGDPVVALERICWALLNSR
jgi:hypothetical protein